MADLRLITILPPQPVQGVQQPQITGNSSPQSGIASYQAGSILSGFIINRDSNGNPVLRTEGGDITFASNFFLKIGSEITIRIEHIAGNNSAHILSVNGQPPEVAVLQSGFVPDPEVIVSENLRSSTQSTTNQPTANNAASSSTSTQSPAPIIIVTGTIISPVTDKSDLNQSGLINSNLANNPTPTLPNGSQLSLKIIALSTPQITTSEPDVKSESNTVNSPQNTRTTQNTLTQNSAPNSVSTTIPNTYAAYIRTSAATPATPISPEILSQNNTAQSLASAPAAKNPAAPLPSNVLPQIGQQISAIVISNDPNGEAIIQTPVGIIRLQAGTQLPIGSHVTFEIGEIKTAQTLESSTSIISPNVAVTPAPLTQLARSSGALSNIFVLLSGLGTQEALSFINKNIPMINPAEASANPKEQQAPHNLLSPIFTFAAALRSGDFREWLGRGNAKWLEDNGHENLLKKAEGEFLSISRQFIDTPARQWQSLFFPIAIAGELQQTRLFVKRDRKQKENEGRLSNEEDTRFVVEMDLSQLGEMQMDGFVRNNNKNIQFDLIIRNFIPLSEEIQKEILNIYNNIGELTGYQGSITFQTVKDFPVNPMEDVIADNHESVVI